MYHSTVMSRASAHTQGSANTRASAHTPILTVLWFFEVLRVTAHYAKFLRSESEGRSAELLNAIALYIRYQRFTHTRPWPRLQRSFPATRNLSTASDD